MKTQIANLEGKLKSVSPITPEEKAALEKNLAQAVADKDSAVKERNISLLEKESTLLEK